MLDTPHPMSELSLACDQVEMRPLAPADRGAFEALLRGGIHPPDYMPFASPWSRDTPENLAAGIAYTAGQVAADCRCDDYVLQFAVRRAGDLVGMQQTRVTGPPGRAVGAVGYWLGTAFQGRGIGTLSQAMMCAVFLDHLGVPTLTSSIFADNAPSLASARKVGFTPTGAAQLVRDGEPVPVIHLVLTAATFNRSAAPGVRFAGLAQARRFLGLG